MNCGIYLITNVLDNKKYVGSSINITRRKYRHFYDLKNGKHTNPYLQNAYNKYGKEVFHFMVLEYCDKELLVEQEDYWIMYYNTMNQDSGYNLRVADRSEMSREHKEKISIAMKGKPAHNKGIPMSEEAKARISTANKGRKHSEEAKIKMSTIGKGKKHAPFSEETRIKMSIAQKGNKNAKGSKHSIEAKLKISEARKKKYI